MEKYDIDISEINFIGNQQRARKIIEEKRQQRQENIIRILAIIVANKTPSTPKNLQSNNDNTIFEIAAIASAFLHFLNSPFATM